MNEAMVMPVLNEIDDAQVAINHFPNRSDNEADLFSLSPPYIPGQFIDIDFAPAQVGVNKPMLYTHADGLLVLVQAYLNMAEHDDIKLFIDDKLVASLAVPSDHENADLSLYVAADKIPSGVHVLKYDIQRSSGQLPESAELMVWFKIDPPGGLDPEPDEPGHQLLKPAQLQLTPGKVIDQEVAEEGVTAVVPAWPFMEKGDELFLHFHGVVIQRAVAEEEVGEAIEVFITPRVIAEAGPAHPAVVVYQLRDQVHNVSAFSERLTIISDPGVNWLDPVFVPLADNEDWVGLDEVGYDDLLVEIVTRPGFALNERLQLKWLSTPQGGVAVEHSEEQTITRLGIQKFEIPNAVVLASAPGLVQVDYRRTKVDGSQDPSERYCLSVLGKSLRLPAPLVSDLVGGTLDSGLAQTVVQCGPDERIKTGCRVTLTWLGTTASGQSHLYQAYRDVSESLEGEAIPFIVPAKNIGPLIRGSVVVSYTLSHPSMGAPLESETLTARVGKFEAKLPAPKVEGVVDGVLNPKDVPYGTNIEVAAAAYTQLGDVVHVEGRGDTLESVFRDRLLIEHGKQGQDLDFWLDASTIKAFHDQFFSVLWWLERPKTLPQASVAHEFFLGEASAALQPPTVWRTSGGALDPMENLTGATARVHLAAPRQDDRVQLKVLGAPGAGSPTFEPLPLDAENRAAFPLTTAFIAENLGKKVEFSYELHRNSRTLTSELLELTVKKIIDLNPGLTGPKIAEAGAVPLIDLRIIKTDLTCVIKPPLPIPVVGQRVWIEVSSAGVTPLRLRAGTPLTAEEISLGISVKAARSWFYALKDLSQCEVTCKIALGSTDTESTALVLPKARYTVKVTSALAINTAQMVLSGWKLVGGTSYGLREREVPDNVQTRVPTGGRPPYTYRSANPAVAAVDSQGKVRGLSNQSTTIIVTDADQQQVSYSVRVMNVYKLVLNNTFMTASQASAWFRQVGAGSMNNSGQPFGWQILQNNFVDIMPIYGGKGLYYGRFVSLNLTYPQSYVLEHSLLLGSGVGQGARNVPLNDNTTRSRVMGYVPT